jgi:pimeloyl-ACP methyl ester carboxylesterase
MTTTKNTRDVSIARRFVTAVWVLGRVAAAGVLAGAMGPVWAQDSVKGHSLMAPIPPQVPMVEGVADLGNTKLWYWDTGGSGEVVVLLHPGSGSAEFYPYQQPFFAKAGYRVISYSRRGQYKSEIGTDANVYFASDDLLNLMKYLKVDKFHAVGNALGAYIGLDVAISNPERLRSLVLACSMMGISEPEYTATLQALRPKAFNELPVELKELGPSYRAANPAGVAEWKTLHARSGTSNPVRLRNKITWQALANLKVPTLLLTGDADLYIPPYLLRQVGEKIPNSKIVIVQDSGHGVQWEQPQAFNNAVLDFIQTGPAR